MKYVIRIVNRMLQGRGSCGWIVGGVEAGTAPAAKVK